MIKFTATHENGRRLIGIGLSYENLKRLKNNQPIEFKGEIVELPGWDFLIFAGETEDSMAADLMDG